jgi:hypothetical protein
MEFFSSGKKKCSFLISDNNFFLKQKNKTKNNFWLEESFNYITRFTVGQLIFKIKIRQSEIILEIGNCNFDNFSILKHLKQIGNSCDSSENCNIPKS